MIGFQVGGIYGIFGNEYNNDMVIKGTRMSDESRKKMRDAALKDGRRPPSRKGIKHSEEFKLSVSLRHKGMKDSEETKIRRIASARRGERSHFWKGGTTSEIQKLRMSLEYRTWRTAVFERDNYTCVLCGKIGGKINADHIKRFADFPELRFSIENGRTLCEACHKKTDTFGRWNRNESKNFK
jgi:hypothetical protein